jgi:DNA-binding MarR family transcriptional regulator
MVKPNRQEMIKDLLQLAAKLFRISLPIVPREILDLDVTMTQLKVLFLLFVDGHKRMSDLASDLGVTLATATGLVERMVEKGLVTRESQPDDRRVVLCRLSESGRTSVSRIWESAGNRMGELLKSLDTANLQSLSGALEAMLASAERDNKIAPAIER